MTNDFITKKEISNPKSKLSHLRINEELNIYYVAATRVKKAIDLASLNLDYTYKEGDAVSSIAKPRYVKKTSDKKMKDLQEEWLKKNRVKKVDAF